MADSNVDIEEQLSVVVLPEWFRIPWPHSSLPEQVILTKSSHLALN